MKKSEVLLSVSLLTAIVLVFYLIFLTIKFDTRNDYHRSKMFEYELLSQVTLVTPIGTSLEIFLSEFSLPESAYRTQSQTSGYVSIKPSLKIPDEEQRDYTGFSFYFINNKLVKYGPNGPQPANYEINLTGTPIGNKIKQWQRP